MHMYGQSQLLCDSARKSIGTVHMDPFFIPCQDFVIQNHYQSKVSLRVVSGDRGFAKLSKTELHPLEKCTLRVKCNPDRTGDFLHKFYIIPGGTMQNHKPLSIYIEGTVTYSPSEAGFLNVDFNCPFNPPKPTDSLTPIVEEDLSDAQLIFNPISHDEIAEKKSATWNNSNQHSDTITYQNNPAKFIQQKVSENPIQMIVLMDVSGSMNQNGRIAVVRSALANMLDLLKNEDQLALITYSSKSEVLLPFTAASEKDYIINLFNNLTPKGTSQGDMAIRSAYDLFSTQERKSVATKKSIVLLTDGAMEFKNENLVQKIIESGSDNHITFSAIAINANEKDMGRMQSFCVLGNGSLQTINEKGINSITLLRAIFK